jgi:SAM-dependent methyltransferase
VKKQTAWFESWFDSPYYHRLYKHRDEEEAENLLSALISEVPMVIGSTVLDVACGKGRHSVFLNKNGFDVTGFDLSEASIQHNLSFENDTLHFYVHDMRNPFRTNYFDYAINLFSSFGYFDNEHENHRAMKAILSALKKGGTFIFDYANGTFIRKQLFPSTTEEVDGTSYRITKRLEDHHVIKSIEFTSDSEIHCFEERLRLYSYTDLSELINACGGTIVKSFGDYRLQPFNDENSERILLVVRKN